MSYAHNQEILSLLRGYVHTCCVYCILCNLKANLVQQCWFGKYLLICEHLPFQRFFFVNFWQNRLYEKMAFGSTS